ncbi:MAG: hypothetical protein KDD53_04345 [Bdellovibrionales bacterium]|nr:hypothetical protein [Bdellovibrionales bacterium]
MTEVPVQSRLAQQSITDTDFAQRESSLTDLVKQIRCLRSNEPILPEELSPDRIATHLADSLSSLMRNVVNSAFVSYAHKLGAMWEQGNFEGIVREDSTLKRMLHAFNPFANGSFTGKTPLREAKARVGQVRRLAEKLDRLDEEGSNATSSKYLSELDAVIEDTTALLAKRTRFLAQLQSLISEAPIDDARGLVKSVAAGLAEYLGKSDPKNEPLSTRLNPVHSCMDDGVGGYFSTGLLAVDTKIGSLSLNIDWTSPKLLAPPTVNVRIPPYERPKDFPNAVLFEFLGIGCLRSAVIDAFVKSRRVRPTNVTFRGSEAD